MAPGIFPAEGRTAPLLVPPSTHSRTYLFRGIAPEFAQPLADCLTKLHRETCEILTESETISDWSFDMARIPEGAGLGFADDILECFPTSLPPECRVGQPRVCRAVYANPAHLHDQALPVPVRQLASALLKGRPDEDRVPRSAEAPGSLPGSSEGKADGSTRGTARGQKFSCHHLLEWEMQGSRCLAGSHPNNRGPDDVGLGLQDSLSEPAVGSTTAPDTCSYGKEVDLLGVHL